MKVAFSGVEDEIEQQAQAAGLTLATVYAPRSPEQWRHAATFCDVLLLRDEDLLNDKLDGVPMCEERPFEQVLVYLGESDLRFGALCHRDSSNRSVVLRASSILDGMRAAGLVRRAWRQWASAADAREAAGGRTRWLIEVTREHSIVSVTDVHGTILFVNRKFEELSGYSAAELVGSTHRKLKSGEQSHEVFEGMWQAISSGRVWEGTLCNRRKDGSLYWVAATIIPEVDDLGLPVRYFSASTDITSGTLAGRELVHAKEVADRANMAKSEFLSGMSHELRTPLNAVIGFAQLLREEAPIRGSSRLSMWVDQISKGGEHLLSLVNQVLDLARVEAGKVTLSLENVEISKVITESVSLVKGMAEKAGVAIYVRAGESAGDVYAEADHTRLKQVLLNLLSNAVKYNTRGGRVFVGYVQDGDSVVISIRDTGIGIAESDRVRLFVPFERLGAPGSHIEGSGIGLALSKKVVEAMGGGISYEPNDGAHSSGSLFKVRLRGGVHPVQETQFDAPLTEFDGLSSESKYVIYIEDNPANQLLMKEMLYRFSNVELDCAGTAEVGLAMTKVRCPDLIIMDFNLPGMSGLDAVRVVRAADATSHVPVLCLTADVMRPQVRRDAAQEFDEFMAKPVKVREFRRVMERLLRTGLQPRD
jgi:PAS domain S-box-containing protein